MVGFETLACGGVAFFTGCAFLFVGAFFVAALAVFADLGVFALDLVAGGWRIAASVDAGLALVGAGAPWTTGLAFFHADIEVGTYIVAFFA